MFRRPLGSKLLAAMNRGGRGKIPPVDGHQQQSQGSGPRVGGFRDFIASRNTDFLGVSAKNPLLRVEHYIGGEAAAAAGLLQGGSSSQAAAGNSLVVPDVYSLRRELARKYSAAQSEKLRGDFERILGTLRELYAKHKLNRRSWGAKGNSMTIDHEIMSAYSRQAILLRPRHFVVASHAELIELMHIGGVMKVNSSHIITCSAQTLLHSLAKLNANQLASAVLSIAAIRDGGLAPEHRTRIAMAFFAEIMRRPQCGLDVMSVGRAMAIVNMGQQSAVGSGVIPDGMSRDFLRTALTTYGSDSAAQRWGVQDVATLCSAVVHHRLVTDDAVKFFVAAAPVCIEEVIDLTPKQISIILLAFATVRYHDVKLFLTLGQRAGDLGETMAEDDVGRIIRAFEMTTIGFDSLRNSLESAMRLKNIHRSPLSTVG